MSELPLHPAIVHLPIGLSLVVPIVAIVVAGLIATGMVTAKAWFLPLGLQLLLVLSSFASMRSGEQDEEVVEDVVAERVIHEHEEAAEAFTWTTVAVLALALAGAFVPNEKLSTYARLAASAGTLVALGLAFNVGHKGGLLVYKHGAAAAHVQAAGGGAGGGSGAVQKPGETTEQKHDDDDDD